MDTLLRVVRSECQLQRKRMTILGKMEALAQEWEAIESTPVSEPKPAPHARTQRRTSSRGTSRNPSRAAICRHIGEHGPIGRADLNRALGGNVKSLDMHLRRLLRDGEIRIEGQRPRRYRLSDAQTPNPSTHVESTRASRPTAVMPCTGEKDLLALITHHGAVTTRRLRELTGLGDGQIIQWGRALARRRVVAFDGEGPERTWRPVGERNLASEIRETVAADPGRYNDHRLALALRAPYERVALACAELIDQELIALTDDNTYVPVDGEEALEVAS